MTTSEKAIIAGMALLSAFLIMALSEQGDAALNQCKEVATLETCIKQGVSQ